MANLARFTEESVPRMHVGLLPVLLFVACLLGLAIALLVIGNLFNPGRKNRVKAMPYESGMDPIHGARRQFDVRFYLLAIAFLVFDVELLFLYPWAVTARPAKLAAMESVSDGAPVRAIDATVKALQNSESVAAEQLIQNHSAVFVGVMVFIGLLTLGLIYDWRKGVFRWR